MMLRARWFVDRSLRVHENGSVDCAESKGDCGEALDLGDAILMPGLVNAHCHLDYTDMRGLIPPSNDFTPWIAKINRLKRSWDDEDYFRSIQNGLREAVQMGTTAMANWVCLRKAASRIRCPIRMAWFWEQIAFQKESLGESWEGWERERLESQVPCQTGLAPHAPYTCRSDVIRRAARWCARHGRPWSIHVAESREEFEMIRHGRGPFFEMFQSLGRDMSDCGTKTPLELLREEIAGAQVPILLAHANLLTGSDLSMLRSAGSPHLSIVHCPRSHRYFGRPAFPWDALARAGVRLCLGTDSLASNTDLSMFSEMNQAALEWPTLDPHQIVRMATFHGAQALGAGEDWPHWRDWIAIRASPRRASDVWSAITHFTGRPHFVMVGGRIVSKI